jgi:hypothetical protein
MCTVNLIPTARSSNAYSINEYYLASGASYT